MANYGVASVEDAIARQLPLCVSGYVLRVSCSSPPSKYALDQDTLNDIADIYKRYDSRVVSGPLMRKMYPEVILREVQDDVLFGAISDG
jgi:uncharacterized protein (UPF0276 family)